MVVPFLPSRHGSAVRDGGGPEERPQGHQTKPEAQAVKKTRGKVWEEEKL